MPIYKCNDGSYQGTLASANAHGGVRLTINDFSIKNDVIALLNDARETALESAAPAPAPEAIGDPTQAGVDADRIDYTANRKRQWTADEICEFIQDEATQAQVENIFTSLGVRFGESRK